MLIISGGNGVICALIMTVRQEYIVLSHYRNIILLNTL